MYHVTSLDGLSYSDFASDNGAREGQSANPITAANSLIGQNLIEVTGTTLAFNPPPPMTPIERETGFSMTIEAQDENGNLDADEASVLTLSVSDGVEIESLTGTPALVNGTVTLDDIVLDTANMATDLTITIADSDDVVREPIGYILFSRNLL